jgi:hypothetical protein
MFVHHNTPKGADGTRHSFCDPRSGRPEGLLLTRIKDARVHCVVLKVRAVPRALPHWGNTSRSGGPFPPTTLSSSSEARSLRTQQRACRRHPPSSVPDQALRRAATVLTAGIQPTTKVNVPPLSKPPRAFARVVALGYRSIQKLLRKEVIQPHLPVRLPCYDLVLITDPTFDSSLLAVGPLASGVTDFHDLTGGVYKARERIHRSVADLRLLATPTS